MGGFGVGTTFEHDGDSYEVVNGIDLDGQSAERLFRLLKDGRLADDPRVQYMTNRVRDARRLNEGPNYDFDARFEKAVAGRLGDIVGPPTRRG
jgi:hypothetical protein